MPLVWQEKSLQMEWCLDCHRHPEKYLRPKSEVFNIAWKRPRTSWSWGAKLAAEYKVRPQVTCSTATDEPGTLRQPSPWSSRACAAGPPETGPRRYWKSLDELADDARVPRVPAPGVPGAGLEFEDPTGRREFLTLMGASLALAGLTACTRQPDGEDRAVRAAPEELVPGRPLFFATAAGHDGYARGILVESHKGRPTKIEGNPDHPASLGATDVFGQASVLALYDPDRSQTVLYARRGPPVGRLPRRAARGARQAEGEAGRGPALPDRPRDLAHAGRADGRASSPAFPRRSGPVGAGRPRQRARGRRARLRRARRDAVPLRPGRRVLSLEADFVASHPASLRLVREFAARRKAERARSRR